MNLLNVQWNKTKSETKDLEWGDFDRKRNKLYFPLSKSIHAKNMH